VGTYFSFRKLTSSISPNSPKSLLSFSSLNNSKSSMLPMYTFRVAPECTANASEGGSGPEFFPHPILRRRLLSVRPWYEDTWKNVKAAAGSTNVTNWIYASRFHQKPRGFEESRKTRTAICLSCMYRTLCNTPPLIALHRSSVVVSGWMFPKYTVLLSPCIPAPAAMPMPSGENAAYGENGAPYGFAPNGVAELGVRAADCTRDCAAAA
jgi:hypothetical protein